MSGSDITAQRFSRSAHRYEIKAFPHRIVADELLELLPESEPEMILELGCGTGFLTRLLSHRYPASEIDAVDFAAGMVERTAASLPSGRVRVWLADARTFSSSRRYSLITSASSLQWMRPLDSLFLRMTKLLAPGGVFAFTLFGEGTFSELRALRAEIMAGKDFISSMPSLSEVRSACAVAGLSITHLEQKDYQDIAANGWAALRRARELGFTGGSLSAAKGRLTRRELNELADLYDKRYHQTGGVKTTFSAIFCVSNLTHAR